ncbi:MAG: hypothetical protein JW384_01651 [Nitrosomonadaceae bacterium]|nr:hypothetical protein [Nitrosomonadaceae bacterium]
MKFAIIAALVGLVFGREDGVYPGLPGGVKILTLPSHRLLVQVDAVLGMSYSDARLACNAIGGSLADLYNNNDFTYLATKVEGPHWIKSFEGGYFNEALPPAIFPGGAIATPRELGGSSQGVLCQVV